MSAADLVISADSFPWLVLFGLLMGALGGFFGVRGGFFIVPMLNVVFGVPYHLGVGSNLGQMFGSSTAATIRYLRFGNIDFKLGFFLMAGTVLGVEAGANILETLEHSGEVVIFNRPVSLMTLIMSLGYAALLIFLGTSMIREAQRTLKRAAGKGVPTAVEHAAWPIALRLRTTRLWPMVSLPASGITSISLWVIVIIGFFTGFLTGLLGVGGSFVRIPALVYILGCPAVVAVGTDLFEVVFSSAFGVFTHALKGNVHLVLVLSLLAGTTVGAQVGTSYTGTASAPWVRLCFGCVALVGVLMVALKLYLEVVR